MAARTRVLVVVLFATMLVATFAAVCPSTKASVSVSNAPATGAMSVVNKVPDFYAEGKGEAYSSIFMKISSKGGYLNTGSTTIKLTPWGYVTADWAIGKVYIILLANVTQNDFYIAYLYLTNSSSPMIIRLFQYRYATLKSFMLTGVQYVFARYTTTIPVEMPAINIVPKAQSGNAISALGPELYLNQKSGRVINGTSTWNAFPLLEQYFQEETEYNEIWTLFSDDAGGYYFGIFYLPNNDPNHVILEHQVRLNDYQTYSGRSFDAAWTKKGFPYLLTVKIPQQSIVKVNGFPVETDSKGVASIYVPKASVAIEAPSEINAVDGSRWRFSTWTNFGDSNPLTMQVGSNLQLSANYQKQFMLTIDSEFGNVQGAGWYDEGANATISAAGTLPSDGSTQRAFVRWEGDYASESNPSTVQMDSPKRVIVIWKTQYDVTLQLTGVSSDATAQIAVNGQSRSINGSAPAHIWVDANSEISIVVQSMQIPGTSVNYNFAELRVDGQPSGANILVTKPLTIDLIYSSTSKTPSSMDLGVNPQSALQGQELTISGRVSVQSTVNLYYSSDNSIWEPLAEVRTASDGGFTYAWKPSGPGTYFIRAHWSGDENYEPASQTVSVQVRQGFGVEPGSSGLPGVVQVVTERVNGIPVLSFIVRIAGSLLGLGLLLAGLFAPGNPQFLGYFIGSLLIGFVFIFPISALVLALKAARSHRSPRVAWLIPFATIWLGALVMFLANELFFFAPTSALDAIQLLLVASNAVFIPLASSVGLARMVSD